jgi:hypothetical protein
LGYEIKVGLFSSLLVFKSGDEITGKFVGGNCKGSAEVETIFHFNSSHHNFNSGT